MPLCGLEKTLLADVIVLSLTEASSQVICCAACPSNCVTCPGNPSVCTHCINGYYVDIDNTCSRKPFRPKLAPEALQSLAFWTLA